MVLPAISYLTVGKLHTGRRQNAFSLFWFTVVSLDSKIGIKKSYNLLLEEYKLSLHALNRSPKTISWYSEILTAYFSFLESGSLLKPVDEMGNKELIAYILHLQKATKWAGSPHINKNKGKLSPCSIQGHVRALKAFWGWLEKEEHIEKNPLAKFPLPKVPEKPVQVLSLEQIQLLLSHIDRHTPKGAMHNLIILLLLDTGIRISELTGIKTADVDLPHGCVKVMGKGQKVRSAPFAKETRKQLLGYINKFRPQLCPAGSPYLFAGSDGSPISVNCVQQLLRRLAIKAGLNGTRVSPHVFRHTFATMAVAGGANVLVLKDILGHNCLATTMKYTHLQPQDLQLQHATFSPVAKLISEKKLKH